MRELIEQTIQWHVKWTTHMHEWAQQQTYAYPGDLRIPSMCFSFKGGRVAGQYNRGTHRCIYMLGYICTVGSAYEEVVAHEVCHAYQWQLMPKTKWHGEMFKFLLNRVCGFEKAGTHHHFSSRPTKQLEGVFLLNEKAIVDTINDVKARMQNVDVEDTRKLPVRARKTRRHLAPRDKGPRIHRPSN